MDFIEIVVFGAVSNALGAALWHYRHRIAKTSGHAIVVFGCCTIFLGEFLVRLGGALL